MWRSTRAWSIQFFRSAKVCIEKHTWCQISHCSIYNHSNDQGVFCLIVFESKYNETKVFHCVNATSRIIHRSIVQCMGNTEKLIGSSLSLRNELLLRNVCCHFSHVWIFATLWTVTHQDPLILQARILEWIAISFSRWSSQSRDRTHVSYISCIARQVLYH